MQTTAFQEELTPLQQLVRACIQGDSSSVLSLLLQLAREENSIDINHSDAEGTPPLCYASCWGHSHIVALLLAAGADVDRCDKNGWTPLMWAAASSHDVITQLLLDHGADPTRTNQKGQKLEEIVRSSSSLSSYSETASVSIEHAVHLENELQQAQREKFIKEKNAFIKSDDEDDRGR
ncbi:ankyrin repeat-containing domain protein [Obelidium mucronatum]|nr:ankyrin repeat-containing domain protein [Obelidium mucronatum]